MVPSENPVAHEQPNPSQIDSEPIEVVDLGLSDTDRTALDSAYNATMTACEGGGEGTYG